MERTCLILVAFTALAAFGVQAQEGRNTITEEWRCFALFDFSKETVAVELTRKTPDGEAKGSGEVSVAGFTHKALFRIAGVERRWDFGDEFNYAFVIKPGGDGAYYDFSSVEDGGTTSPSQRFNCVSP